MDYRNNFDVSVYFVADSSVCKGRAIVDVVVAAVRGGATMVQLRNKIDPIYVVEHEARAVQKVLSDYKIPLIINDYVELAIKIDADGAHIGQGDMSACDARGILGENKILGVTAFTQGHYDEIDTQIIDYVGTGPFNATKTKPDKAVLGAKVFTELTKTLSIPVVAIGGITPDNAGAAIKAGADGVAMMRAISESACPEKAANLFVEAVRKAR